VGLTFVIQGGYDGYAGGEPGKGGPKLVFIKQSYTYIKRDAGRVIPEEEPILYTLEYPVANASI